VGAVVLGTLCVLAQQCRSTSGGAAMPLRVTSSSFQPNGEIPAKHTCEGGDVSPALSWSAVPAGTKSLAVVIDDPDAPDPRAPTMTWVHWVLYDLPPTVDGLAEGVTALPDGTHAGKNDWKTIGYRGPCPPIGRHRYFHHVYALDQILPDLAQPDRAALDRAMKGHVLAEGAIVGTYAKNGAR
jgi:Raf kinase inhibitor-like YbhB/YbcL family protein